MIFRYLFQYGKINLSPSAARRILRQCRGLLYAFQPIRILCPLFLFLAVFCPFPLSAAPSFFDQANDQTLAAALVAAMTDSELLGQLFFLGYPDSAPAPYILQWISGRNLGGVKIFSRNVNDLPTLARDIYHIQQLAAGNRLRIPPFVATDQEGGWVRHIKAETIITPGNLGIGATGLPQDAYLTGYYIGRELSLLGINMNFAPDVDIYTNPENSGIGPRAFSSDPLQTGVFALAYYNGMERAGIICTAKHFPGHGDADLDSHGYLPEIKISFETMWNRELVPYRLLIKEGLPAIMTGHIAFPQILGSKTPATLSSYFCNDVLRNQLGFKGVLITDSLEMWGVRAEITDFAEISRLAILAGNDMVLIAHSPDKQEQTWQRLSGLIKSDQFFRTRVRESVQRILLQKMRFFKGNKPVTLFPDYNNVLRNIRLLQQEEAEDFVFQTSCRSVTLLRNKEFPYHREAGEKLLLLGQYSQFIEQGLKRYPGADHYEYSYYPANYAPREEREKIHTLIQGYDTVIFCLVNENSLEVLENIRKVAGKVIVISSLTPVYLDKLPWVETALAIYGTSEVSYQAAFAALAGDFIPGGKLPLKFPAEKELQTGE